MESGEGGSCGESEEPKDAAGELPKEPYAVNGDALTELDRWGESERGGARSRGRGPANRGNDGRRPTG